MLDQFNPKRRPKLMLLLATNAGLGFAPVAPGTFGTLAGIPFFYYLSQTDCAFQVLAITAIMFLSFWACEQAGRYFGNADDGRIVIDELCGYLITTAFLPFSWSTAIYAFIWFRICDIAKFPPVNWIDRELKTGVGVTLDDVLAGIYAMILLRLTLLLVG